MISVTKEQLDEMIKHSYDTVPDEACGLMAGANNKVEKIFIMTNDERSGTRYLVNPKEQFRVFKQIREEGLELLGIYHSHVKSEAYPSETDRELAFYDVLYFIVSLEKEDPNINAFRINNGKVTEESFEVV